MSDDWNSVTKIGSKARGGTGPREVVVRGKGALNAAMRSGDVSSEKKFAVGNAAKKPGAEGQYLTKVDRSDDIVKPKEVGTEVGNAIKNRRNDELYKCTQKELAQKCNTTPTIIAQYESGRAQPDNKILSAIETQLNIVLRSGKKKLGDVKDEKREERLKQAKQKK